MPTKPAVKANSPRQNPLYLDSKRRKAALDRIKREVTVDITTMRCGIGIGRDVAYRDAANFGGLFVAGRWIFPTSKLRELLGLTAESSVRAA